MNTLKKLLKKQDGMAFILALVVLAVGGLILGPLIGLVTTSLNVGKNVEIGVETYYATDAGIENANWHIIKDLRLETPDYTYVPEDVGTNRTFTIPGPKGQTLNIVINKVQEALYRVQSTAPSGVRIVSYIASSTLYLFNGALVSSNDITLKKDTTIIGDVYCIGDFDPQGALNHPAPGKTLENQTGLIFPSDEQNALFAKHYEDLSKADGVMYSGNYNINSSGSYGSMFIDGNFTTGNNLTITLTGTLYVTGEINIGINTTISCAADISNIVAEGDIGFEKVTNFGESASLIYSVYGNIKFKKEAGSLGPDGVLGGGDDDPLEALIYAPNGNISFDKQSTVKGSVVAGGGIDVPMNFGADKEFSIEYDPAYKYIMDLPEISASAIRTWTITNP